MGIAEDPEDSPEKRKITRWGRKTKWGLAELKRLRENCEEQPSAAEAGLNLR
jgi:hypothetical protein